MTTMVAKLGPADRGRPMTLEEFCGSDWEEGYQYELIDGKLYVSPLPDLPQGWIEQWLLRMLLSYSLQHPEIINFLYNKCRVFVPGRPGVTNPEPDIAAYHGFLLDRDIQEVRWEDVSPFLVVEVLSLDDPAKDLVRNVELYHQVPSIKEYWVLDSREDANRPTMRVHRRYGKSWRIKELAFGDMYTTRLLPGFELILDPRQ
jgi:Uma2 family endonuclease